MTDPITTTESEMTDPITTTEGITSSSDPTTETTSKIETPEPTTTEQTTTEFMYLPEFLMTRDDWGAEPPRSSNISKLELPIKRIIVGHTAGSFCFDKVDYLFT